VGAPLYHVKTRTLFAVTSAPTVILFVDASVERCTPSRNPYSRWTGALLHLVSSVSAQTIVSIQFWIAWTGSSSPRYHSSYLSFSVRFRFLIVSVSPFHP
jgi:hypothetical protein